MNNQTHTVQRADPNRYTLASIQNVIATCTSFYRYWPPHACIVVSQSLVAEIIKYEGHRKKDL